MEHLIPRSQQSDDFDLEFWQKVSASQRFAAAWDMVREFCTWKKKHAGQQRLRRSAEILKQR